MKAHLLALGVGLLLCCGPAGAADLIYQPQPAPEPYVTPAPVAAGGWYLRGDISYDFNDVRGVHYKTPADTTVDFLSGELDDGVNLGAGIGYQFSKHFRADLTGDYMFKADFHGSTSCAGNCATYQSEDSGVSLLSLLANAYVDLGTWHRITPYVGAGIGATYVDWSDFDESGCPQCASYPKGKSDWRFTWAVMAGASVDLTCNLKFDAGYRFRHIDGGDVFDDIGNDHGFDDGFNVNEVRGGLRYTFGGCQPQPIFTAYQPAPVYK